MLYYKCPAENIHLLSKMHELQMYKYEYLDKIAICMVCFQTVMANREKQACIMLTTGKNPC